MRDRWMALGLALLALTTTTAAAQPAPRTHLVAPQAWSSARGWTGHAPLRGPVRVTGVEVKTRIAEQLATTRMVVRLHNPRRRAQQAVLMLAVPAGAVVRGFDFMGGAAEPTAKLLSAAEAKSTYDGIVRRLKDPALLEFAGDAMIKSSVFPVPARGTQAIAVTYEHLCPRDGRRIEYRLPRTQVIARADVPWSVEVELTARAPLATIYSPTHPVDVTRHGARKATVKLTGAGSREPGAFQLYTLLGEPDRLTASLLASPAPGGDGGYFMLLAGVPTRPAKDAVVVRRELTLVIDRSGSMRGEKIAQARAAALQVLNGLAAGEAFNVVTYAGDVEMFSPRPVVKSALTMAQVATYVRQIEAGGGTNLHAAVLEAVRQAPRAGMLPLVLLLSDGVPTVGVTSEAAIRTDVEKANRHERRIFAFGVGHDVNTPLMDRLSQASRGTLVSVLPREDVEVKVSSLFAKLTGPALAAPALVTVDAAGTPTTRRIRQLQPARLPDLFAGDQLVLVGRYRGTEPLHFRLSGSYFGVPRTFAFTFPLDRASLRHAYVARMWASRRIASLIDALRQMGASRPVAQVRTYQQPKAEPLDARRKELVDEIVHLSTRFGILTEYTAFLAREGTDLSAAGHNGVTAWNNIYTAAVRNRSGRYATSQQSNLATQRGQAHANTRNGWNDANMERVEITTVQQAGPRAFYNRGGRWVDGAALAKGGTSPTIDETVTYGTARFEAVFKALAAEHNLGALAVGRDVVVRIDGKTVRIVFDDTPPAVKK